MVLATNLLENREPGPVGLHHVKLGEVRVSHSRYANAHLARVFLENLLEVCELCSNQVGELTPLPIHAHVFRMVGPAFCDFVPGCHVMLQLHFLVPVGEGAAVAEPACIRQPVFADFGLFFQLEVARSFFIRPW